MKIISALALFVFILNCVTSRTVQPVSPDITLQILEDQTKSVLQYITDLEAHLTKRLNESSIIFKNNIGASHPFIPSYKDCQHAYENGNHENGVYSLHLFHGQRAINILCDMQTIGAFTGRRGWMTIQHRMNGKVNFNRGWNDYLHGFGFPNEEHWIGLKNLLSLSRQFATGKRKTDTSKLRIDIEDWDGVKAFMEYDSFAIRSEEFDFQIAELGRYNATKGLVDHLGFSMYSPFSTSDHNNDRLRDSSCIESQSGGWWFGSCLNINLNGAYPKPDEKVNKRNIFVRSWKSLNPRNTALRYVSIKLQ